MGAGSKRFRNTIKNFTKNNRSACRKSWILILAAIATSTSVLTGSVEKVPKLCSRETGKSKCEMKSAGERMVCRKAYRFHYEKAFWKAKTVVLCSWSEWYLNPEEILTKFPIVEKLVIVGGNVSELLTDFPASPHVRAIIMNNLYLEELRPTLFSSLSNLRYLDLSGNKLKNLHPDTIANNPTLSKVNLTGNPWNCASDLKWMLKHDIRVKLVDSSGILCSDNIYSGKPVTSVMFLLEGMESECPVDKCSCTMHNIVWDTTKSFLVPVITVNCTGRGLSDLPEKLPLNTTTLILKRNNITDLLSLIKSKVYSNIADIYLDNNNIGNIDLLEGALWLSQFRVLSLRGNRLKELPTYALDNSFEKNSNMAKLYLGDNPWKCSCLFASEFQHLLIKYRSLIKDERDIKCAEKEGHENSGISVLDVSITSVCAPSTTEINPLDVLSGVLAFLIILVIGKLIYDYWTFKRTGKLPCIVAKIP